MAYKNFKMTEIIEEIGGELRKIRTARKQTISFVAGELAHSGLHISNTLLGRIENGERRIDDDTLQSICAFYDIAPSSLVISASREHIRRLSENQDDNVEPEILLDLYNNLNLEGQKEIVHLIRLMAYMEAFKKQS